MQNNTSPKVTAWDGVRVQEILQLAINSINTPDSERY
jgi:hypothetical protein